MKNNENDVIDTSDKETAIHDIFFQMIISVNISGGQLIIYAINEILGQILDILCSYHSINSLEIVESITTDDSIYLSKSLTNVNFSSINHLKVRHFCDNAKYFDQFLQVFPNLNSLSFESTGHLIDVSKIQEIECEKNALKNIKNLEIYEPIDYSSIKKLEMMFENLEVLRINISDFSISIWCWRDVKLKVQCLVIKTKSCRSGFMFGNILQYCYPEIFLVHESTRDYEYKEKENIKNDKYKVSIYKKGNDDSYNKESVKYFS